MHISDLLREIDKYINTEVVVEANLYVPRNKTNPPYLQSDYPGPQIESLIKIKQFSETLDRKLIAIRKTKHKDYASIKNFAYVENLTMKGFLTSNEGELWLFPLSATFHRDSYTQYVPADIYSFDYGFLEVSTIIDNDIRGLFVVHGDLIANDIRDLYYLTGVENQPQIIDDAAILNRSIVIHDERFKDFLEIAIGAAIGSPFMYNHESYLKCEIVYKEDAVFPNITNHVEEAVIYHRATAIHYHPYKSKV